VVRRKGGRVHRLYYVVIEAPHVSVLGNWVCRIINTLWFAAKHRREGSGQCRVKVENQKLSQNK